MYAALALDSSVSRCLTLLTTKNFLVRFLVRKHKVQQVGST